MAACITNMPRGHYIGVSVAGAFGNTTAITTKLAIVSNSHTWTPEYVEDDSHRGVLWSPSEGVLYNKGMGSGSVVIRPRAADLYAILPLLIGGVYTGVGPYVIKPGILCDFFRLMADKGISVYTHANCKTNSWSLSSSTGSPVLQLEWNIDSCAMTRGAAGSFTTGLEFSTQNPFIHSRSTVTIGGVVYKVDDVTIACNNNLQTDIFFNSQTRTDLAPGNQVFTFTHSSPFDLTADLALEDLAATSVAASVVYTVGGLSMTIDFPALHAPVPTPITPAGNTPVRYEGLTWTARTTGTGAAIVTPITITIDPTP